MNAKQIALQIMIIAAMVLNGISPACAFISGGKNFIQICGADGELRSIEVDASFDPFADEEPEVPLSDHLEAMEKCPFCFASTHMNIDGVAGDVIVPVLASGYLTISGGSALPLGTSLALYQPRGPPTLS